MRSIGRKLLALLAVAGGSVALTPSALAQGASPSGSLGGYGAASTYASPGMAAAGSGPMIIPYGGMFEGFMPSRMGGGDSLAFRSRPSAAMGTARTSFSLAPLSGGMSRDRGAAMAPALGGSGLGAPGGMRLGGAAGRRAPGPGGMGVMPPSFGYPFRQPPSLVPASAPGAGMSM